MCCSCRMPTEMQPCLQRSLQEHNSTSASTQMTVRALLPHQKMTAASHPSISGVSHNTFHANACMQPEIAWWHLSNATQCISWRVEIELLVSAMHAVWQLVMDSSMVVLQHALMSPPALCALLHDTRQTLEMTLWGVWQSGG